MNEVREIKLGEKTVLLDPKNLEFSEHSLSDYMEHESGWVDYYGAMLSDAEYLQARAELAYDVLYSERFKEHKENGCSDKLAECSAKADHDVEEAKKVFLAAKHKVRLLQQHLRAWDRAHENAQSRGHFLRKEMDKLNKDIYAKPDNYLERRVEEIVKEVDLGDLS
jgi:hypothetical protein